MRTSIARQALTQHDLVRLLNFELSAYEQCSGCRFTCIKPMPAADCSGCNWRDAQLEADHRLGLVERGIVRRVIRQTRQEFNVC